MKQPKGIPHHNCCPAEWRQTPNMTGSYELDATIMRMSNKDMADRLKDHLAGDNRAYQIKTPYNDSTID